MLQFICNLSKVKQKSMYRNREEELFWRMIDAYGTPDPDGINSQGDMTGMVYDVINQNIVAPFLQLRCCVNSFGINCRLLINYEGGSKQYSEKMSKLIPEFEVISEKFYSWSDFCFDEFIVWTISCNEWEKVLNIYRT